MFKVASGSTDRYIHPGFMMLFTYGQDEATEESSDRSEL